MSSPTIFWNADRIMKLIITLSLTVAGILLVNYLSDVLLPFFAACFIAYMLQPLVELNRRWTREKGRVLSSFLTVIEVTLVIGGVIYLFMPHVISELDSLGKILHDLDTGKRQLPPEFTGIVTFVQTHFNPEDIRSMVSDFHLDALINKGTSLLNESLSVIIQVLAWFMTVIYVLFILIDYPQISRGFKMIVPYKYREGAMSVVHDVQDSMNHYFRGQGFLALCAMILYCTGFSIIGLPLAIPMGILVGLLYMIPYFQYVTVVPVAIICLIYSLGGAESFTSLFGKSLLVYLVSQPICDYIITPHVMGKEMGLNPAIILLSLSVWGSLLGIIGMIIALPVTSIIMSYYERYISNPRDTETPEKETGQQDDNPA
ncbi:MAG: AI-2E family transporter [Muribaculaceae bacterium]|nr:AI-2E family transporter [Muribaculaceae bacterium]